MNNQNLPDDCQLLTDKSLPWNVDDEADDVNCFSCDFIFELESYNDTNQGYFCDKCLEHDE